jgi:hypothetical protein
MSQVVSAVTSSTKARRSYRKGSPMSAVERQQNHLARKKKRIRKCGCTSQAKLKMNFD